MTRSLRPFVLALLFTHFVVAAATLAGLRDEVERIIRTAPLKGAKVAVSIRDADSGAVLVSSNAGEQMIPASNMKLLTSGAALHALGADFEFATRMLRDGDRLIVVGDGDPGFGDPALLSQMTTPQGGTMDVERFIRLWTQPIMDAGFTRISEIVVDDRVFDREFIHSSWPEDQLNEDYCAQVAGLNFHANVLHFHPRPRPGQPPDISDVRPRATWLKITNNATSQTGGKAEHTPWIARKIGTNELAFRGNVRFAAGTPGDVTAHDMPEFFAHLLADRLQATGMQVGGHRAASVNDPESTGQPIGPAIVTPISTVLKRCNQDSENLYAESLLKRMGHELTGERGSFINGGAILRHIVHQRLRDPALASGLIVADGSGLSRDNRITAALMTAWLASFHNDPELGPTFIESLAVGSESGTLRKRYQSMDLSGAVVQAKTGYINGVSCLSGYVTGADGHRRTFSVLVNGFPAGGVGEAKKVQDQIVRAIARDLATAKVTLGGE
jgi:serine-type D-Ala-D-Ala carboxypeptidase/endopeptidase (penicillin-binding protein 4)